MSKRTRDQLCVRQEQQLLETRKDSVDNLHRQAHGGPPSFVPATMHLTR